MAAVLRALGLAVALALAGCPGRLPELPPAVDPARADVPPAPAANAYDCQCVCDIPLDHVTPGTCWLGGVETTAADGTPVCRGTQTRTVCAPPDGPRPPTNGALAADCAGRVADVATAALRFLYGPCDRDPCPTDACLVTCRCAPVLGPGGDVAAEARATCAAPCAPVPLRRTGPGDWYGNVWTANLIEAPGYAPHCPLAVDTPALCAP